MMKMRIDEESIGRDLEHTPGHKMGKLVGTASRKKRRK
jgi:hypothetical protein